MSRWNTEMIHDECQRQVSDLTAAWPIEKMREKLVEILTAITPIKATLSGLVNNPDRGRHGGMCATSGLFLDLSLTDDVHANFPEPYGYVYQTEKPNWVPVPFKWSEPQPAELQKVEASFANAETLHPDTEILAVWQYATACSIFVGSFDASDVTTLIAACSFGESHDK